MDIAKSPAQQKVGLALEFQQQWFCRAPKAVCISMYLSISGHDLRPIGHAKEQSLIDQRLPRELHFIFRINKPLHFLKKALGNLSDTISRIQSDGS